MDRALILMVSTILIVSGCKPNEADQEVKIFVKEQRKTQIEDLNKALEELNTRKESIEKDLIDAQLFTHFREENKGRIEKNKKDLELVEQRISEARAAVRSLLADLEKSLEAKK